MQYNQQNAPGLALLISDIPAAVQWLKDNLLFTVILDSPKDCIALENGTCKLYLYKGTPCVSPAPDKGYYLTGIAHVALQAADINKAIAWCTEKKLNLQLNNGQSFYNPKVFGEGERYFNIISPFGVVFEVSERIGGNSADESPVIYGLDHIGIPSASLLDEVAFFSELGFTPEFSTVTNYNKTEGTIYCIMLKKSDITLEIYQFADLTPKALPQNMPIQRLVFMQHSPLCSPSGARLV